MTDARKNLIQRRYVVTSYDPDILRSPSKEIEHGYVANMPGYVLRVVIIDGEEANIARRFGSGRERQQEPADPMPLDIAPARFLLESCPYRLVKRRFFRDEWKFDLYEGQLKGLATAEIVMEDRDRDPVFPSWIHEAKEVTRSVTSFHLAKMAWNLGEGDKSAIRDRLPVRVPRIILTGAPCSGKSSSMAALQKELGPLVHCVPEVATIIIAQVGITPPFDDPFSIRKFQQAIYKVQKAFEDASEMHARRENKHALLLDRGTLDNAAYLPGGLPEFERICRTNRQHEFSQYDMVLSLDVPPEQVYNEMMGNNAARKEPYAEAAALGKKFVDIWSSHPKCIRISSTGTWDEKYEKIRRTILEFIEEHRRENISL